MYNHFIELLRSGDSFAKTDLPIILGDLALIDVRQLPTIDAASKALGPQIADPYIDDFIDYLNEFRRPQGPWTTTRLPIRFAPLANLRSAIEQNSDIKPADIITAFESEPRNVTGSLGELRDKNRLRKQRAKKRQIEKDLARDSEQRGRAADPQIEDGARLFEPGTVVALAPVDQIVRRQELDELVKGYIQSLGLNVWGSSDQSEQPTLVKRLWSYWDGKLKRPFSEILAPKFYGALKNPRVLFLPVDQDYVESYVENPEEVDLNNLRRLCLIVDLKSTGRPVKESLVDAVIYLRNSAKLGPMMVLSLRGQSCGAQAIEYLHLESASKHSS